MDEDIVIDISKRTPNEWANIYKVKLYNNIPKQLWSEFEWAYNLTNLDYMLMHENEEDEFSDEMELRAFDIKNMIFKYSDPAEKSILKQKYIETEWIKKKLLYI